MKSSTKKILIGVGLGCGTLILLGVIAVVVMGYYAKQMVDDIQANMENPGPAAQKALGTETMPEGFEPHMAFSIPFIMDMVILREVVPGEEPPPEPISGDSADKDMPNSGLVYINVIHLNDAKKAESFIKGESGEGVEALRDAGIDIDVNQQLGNGQMVVGGTTYHYMNLLGSARMSANPGGGGQFDNVQGLASLILPVCPNDDRTRLFYWFSQDATAAPDENGVFDLTGSGKPGDLQRMESILNGFKICE